MIKAPIYGVDKPSFTEFMAPGIIISITYIMAVGLTAISIVSEQKEGLLERSWVAGVRPFEVILSHVICQFLVMFVQVAGLLVFTFIVFEIPSRGPFVWVVLLTLLQGCGMIYGLVISSMCVEENSAIMLALGSFYPNLLLSATAFRRPSDRVSSLHPVSRLGHRPHRGLARLRRLGRLVRRLPRLRRGRFRLRS
ncbi:hypothetical protein HPB52_024473 [Rhipicephalus sanguineus]|uniref:ABC-2 type transporter transmembrane domain-containing protein n=1 Tax=Rhipicephalus sanguineus TaxID=34632 RepID=A0A9D4SLV0_RHISA|nr:hypothetical protein HPB52_024473 [Rhipicephalus sanguineus]